MGKHDDEAAATAEVEDGLPDAPGPTWATVACGLFGLGIFLDPGSYSHRICCDGSEVVYPAMLLAYLAALVVALRGRPRRLHLFVLAGSALLVFFYATVVAGDGQEYHRLLELPGGTLTSVTS